MQALGNMNEQDVNENGWSGSSAIVMLICALYYFLTFFRWYFFPQRAGHSKSAMNVVFIIVNTLRNAGSAFKQTIMIY